MRTLLIRAIDRATAWLDAQNDRVTARRSARAQRYEVAGTLHPAEVLCPDCVFIRDDGGEIVEAIDCQSNRHALFQKLNTGGASAPMLSHEPYQPRVTARDPQQCLDCNGTGIGGLLGAKDKTPQRSPCATCDGSGLDLTRPA